MNSLRSRLALGLAFSLVLLLMLQWAVASFVIEHLIENQLVSRLTQDGENLLAGMRLDANNRLTIDPSRVNAVYQRPLSGHYYVIDAGNQRLVSRSLWDGKLSVPPVAVGQEIRLHATGPADQRLLIVAHGYRKQHTNITIAVAEDLTALNAGLARFQLIYGVVSLAILAVLLLTQYLIVTRGLRPLKQIRADMTRLEHGEIDRITTTSPAEIAPVVNELNRLLAAMRKRTRRSRDALGNLAHALKTRLSVLSQSTLQTADTRLRAEMEAAIEAMRRIVERELKRARLLGDVLPGRRVDIAEEITLLAQTLRLMHAARNPDIRWQVSPAAHFAGDQEDLLELLGNLLDNACKWCRSSVRLDVQATTDKGIVFTVEDDGPGCPEAALDELTKRGFRADESKPGTGLGLAIVRDIVESYDGRLTLGHSDELGGLRVQVWLPG